LDVTSRQTAAASWYSLTVLILARVRAIGWDDDFPLTDSSYELKFAYTDRLPPAQTKVDDVRGTTIATTFTFMKTNN
jgi:hypothetical protein